MTREEVIKGLECISNGAKQPCRDCEYSKREEWCIAECAKDALALLKAQEPRVLTLEEVRRLEGAMWLEFFEEIGECTRYGYALFAGETSDTVELIARDYYRPLYTFITKEYGTRWRCWTSRPKEEQRKAVT